MVKIERAGGLARQGFRLSLFSDEADPKGISSFCLVGERLSRLCNFARENQQRKKWTGVFCGFWGKSPVVRCGFSVFLQKNLYEFSERGYNGTKGEFLISRIGG